MMRSAMVALTVLLAAVPAARAQEQERNVVVSRIVTREVARVATSTRDTGRDAEQRRNDRETQTDRATRTLNIGADGEIDLSNIAGDIVVHEGGGTSATVAYVKTSRGGTTEDARQMLEMVTVDINERGPRAEIRTRYPNTNRRNFNVTVEFTITAPRNTRLTLKSISGSISVSDIAGGLTLESISGTVKVANAGRSAVAKSISGNVEVIDTKVDGTMEAGTVSGNVLIKRSSARSLTLNSISGGIVLDDITCERVGAQVISGDVQFSGPLQPQGRYELTSHSGNVRVAIASTTGFQLEATSFSGNIETTFGITVQGKQPMGGRQRGLRGTYGDGSAFLDLTTFSGNVFITKR